MDGFVGHARVHSRAVRIAEDSHGWNPCVRQRQVQLACTHMAGAPGKSKRLDASCVSYILNRKHDYIHGAKN